MNGCFSTSCFFEEMADMTLVNALTALLKEELRPLNEKLDGVMKELCDHQVCLAWMMRKDPLSTQPTTPPSMPGFSRRWPLASNRREDSPVLRQEKRDRCGNAAMARKASASAAPEVKAGARTAAETPAAERRVEERVLATVAAVQGKVTKQKEDAAQSMQGPSRPSQPDGQNPVPPAGSQEAAALPVRSTALVPPPMQPPTTPAPRPKAPPVRASQVTPDRPTSGTQASRPALAANRAETLASRAPQYLPKDWDWIPTAVKARFSRERIFIAKLEPDGTWRAGGQVAKDNYLCQHCSKHLNWSNVESHLDSQAHADKVRNPS